MKIRITKKGLPKAQFGPPESLQLNSSVQPNYNWMNVNQEQAVPIPRQNVVNTDGSTTSIGNFGQPITMYATDFGKCGPGMVFSQLKQTCITQQESVLEKEAMDAFSNFMDRKSKGLPTNPYKTTGNEGTASNPMKSPPQPAPAVTNSKTPYAKGYDFIMDPARKVQKALQSPFMQDVYGANAVVSGLVDLATPIAKYFDNRSKIKDANQKKFEAQFNTMQPTSSFRGNFTVNEGLFRPDDRGVNEGMFSNNFNSRMMAEYGGDLLRDAITNPMKIRITNSPKMAYGGQSGYGLDSGSRKVYTDMPDSQSDAIGNSISQQPNKEYVLEAEGGETIWRPDGTHFNITGKRHYENGEKLTAEQAPPQSFIFSDTKKMRIKDPQILARFGVTYKVGGVTPAAIAKRFPLNEYKARLEDKSRHSDRIGMDSDNLSFKKNVQKLAELAMIQEAMKGQPAPALTEAVMGAAQMAYGGYVMPKFQGDKGSSTVPTYQPGFTTTVIEPKKKEDYNLIYPQGFDPNMPSTQHPIGARRVYGKQDWTSSQNMEDFKKRFPEFFKDNPNWDPTKVGSTRQFQEWYNQNVDPTYFSGKDAYGLDDKFGQHTFSAPRWEKKPPVTVKPKYVCKDGKVVISTDGTGFDTETEAGVNCTPAKPGPKYICIDGEVKVSPSGVGFDTPEQAGINCGIDPQKEVPFDFLTPDKMNMAWRVNRMVPNIYMPEMYQLPRRQYPLALDDWFAAAQNRQSTYNTAMDTAAKTNQSQAVGSFLAGLVGAQDASDIARVNSANIDRVDRRQLADMEMDYKTDMFNLGQRQAYSQGVATARQQYDNALNKGVSDAIQSYADAWQSRGDLYDINMRDPYFYRDPGSYKTIFKGAAGNIYDGSGIGYGTNGAGGYDAIGATAGNMYKGIYDSLKDKVPDETRRAAMAQALTMQAINGSRQSSNQTYDAFGMPKSSSRRTTRFNFNQD